jgi:protein TonB
MINKQILQVDLLDILFENRNKAYGAYALRRNYNKRLQWALGISLSCVFLFALINFGSANQDGPVVGRKKEVNISTVEFKKTPLPISNHPQRSAPLTQRRDTRLLIVPDDHATKPEVPTSSELSREFISTMNLNGSSPDSGDGRSASTNGIGNTGAVKPGVPQPAFQPMSSDAQFPGGKEAFAKFLTKNLITPGDLEAGEKKAVLVRFMVDVDGSISRMEIMQSDGEEYSKEVMRVLAKMPKWIPALQNGAKVATWFSQPVTFIGVDQ